MQSHKGIFLLAFLIFLVGCKPDATEKTSVAPDETKGMAHEGRDDWNRKTSLDAYKANGSRSRKWNTDAEKAIEEYLKLRRSDTDPSTHAEIMDRVESHASAAVAKGCDDPLIEYLRYRYASNLSKDELTKALCSSADKMQASQYPAIRKFFSNFRASQYLWQDRDTNVWRRVADYERAAIFNFAEMTQDKSTPIEEISETGHELVNTLSRQKWALEEIVQRAETKLMENWPNEDAAHSIKAALYYHWAWRARGGGYANTVTEEGWKGFKERLAVSREAADKAWSLNPKNNRIPTLMIKLSEGQQRPRKEMESWFAKAMELQPNNLDACHAKLHYLYPQWYGSHEEMLRFGRDCVQSKTWTGTVPLVLVDAHDQIARFIEDEADRKAYWLRPEVWVDISSAYDRFFEKNPEETGWHHNYAKHAYLCEQWEALNKQIALLGKVNYSFFGGEAEYKKMVALAKDHSVKVP